MTSHDTSIMTLHIDKNKNITSWQHK